MPQWIHNRAEHIMAKNPAMNKSTAFAIATQQSHATGHTPSGYGTVEGRKAAKKKYDEPKSTYEQKADPGHMTKSSAIDLVMWKGFEDELLKIAAGAGPMQPATISTVTKALPRLSPSMKQASYSKPRMDMPAVKMSPQNSLPPPLATAAGAI
jgi:hypothetical protein